MTPEEWQGSAHPREMFLHLAQRRFALGERVCLLWGVAVARLYAHGLRQETSRALLDAAEAYGETRSPQHLLLLRGASQRSSGDHNAGPGRNGMAYACQQVAGLLRPEERLRAFQIAYDVAWSVSWDRHQRDNPDPPRLPGAPDAADPEILRWSAALLRCILGDPFRPLADRLLSPDSPLGFWRFEPAWRTPEVRQVALGIYGEGAWRDTPVLADALEEAGCAEADLLKHLREDGPHAKGCWAVDFCRQDSLYLF